jgi:hypothetical protein
MKFDHTTNDNGDIYWNTDWNKQNTIEANKAMAQIC